MISRPMQ